MGVVYKFRKEVIDFVLQQKRTDHDLGCRQLAALISEKFKIQVSKSSVNAIIKSANLSNAVGRPPSDEAPAKKFQIPSQKKQQLLNEVQKIKLEQKPLPPKVLPQVRKDPMMSLSRDIPGQGHPGLIPGLGQPK
ncbi:MAG TPA: helix-turn-helix domain-containing protein, partial [bacterium]|nr:helix-turn-helix domain-containing protein [bacterium]